MLQRRAVNNETVSDVPPIVHDVLRSPGQPLDKETRAYMEPRFGHDFSRVSFHGAAAQPIQTALAISRPDDDFEREADRMAGATTRIVLPVPKHTEIDFSHVRIHTDPRAAQSAWAVNAAAYTVGSDIVFAEGRYAPKTMSGRHLLAHELAHVVQQRQAATTAVLARVALTPDDFDALAETLHNAMAGLGTDEEAIYVALQKLERDATAIRTLRTTYLTRFGQDLENEIRGEMSGSELDFALELLSIPPAAGLALAPPPSTPGQFEAAARRLEAAMAGLGTDEEAIYATLLPLNRDPALAVQLKTTYQRVIGRSLEAEIHNEMSGSELAYALYLLNAPPPARPRGSFQTLPETGIAPAQAPPPVEGGRVTALTRVRYSTASGQRRSISFAVTYQGGLAADTRWLQFIWREMEVTARDGSVRLLNDTVTIGARNYGLTTDPRAPNYSVDSRSATDPFYEASTSTARREPDLTMIADAPTPIRRLARREYDNGAQSVVSRAHFEIYLIRDYRTLYHVGVDVEHRFRNATNYGTNRQIRVTEQVSELPGDLRAILVRDYPAFTYIR